jgi:hypothetical protein
MARYPADAAGTRRRAIRLAGIRENEFSISVRGSYPCPRVKVGSRTAALSGQRYGAAIGLTGP